ncbi:MAG TPA: hypothetical protein VGF48_15170 [Thermoanaerobaculia bacterium]
MKYKLGGRGTVLAAAHFYETVHARSVAEQRDAAATLLISPGKVWLCRDVRGDGVRAQPARDAAVAAKLTRTVDGLPCARDNEVGNRCFVSLLHMNEREKSVVTLSADGIFLRGVEAETWLGQRVYTNESNVIRK